jgi:hypothetical protein
MLLNAFALFIGVVIFGDRIEAWIDQAEQRVAKGEVGE